MARSENACLNTWINNDFINGWKEIATSSIDHGYAKVWEVFAMDKIVDALKSTMSYEEAALLMAKGLPTESCFSVDILSRHFHSNKKSKKSSLKTSSG